MTLQTNFSSDAEFTAYVQPFKPVGEWEQEIRHYDGKHYMVFYQNKHYSGLPHNDFGYSSLMLLPFQTRSRDDYLPFLAIPTGLRALLISCEKIFTLVILGRSINTWPDNEAINELCCKSTKNIHTLHLTCSQRLVALALLIALFVRSIIQVASLGLLAGLFYPLDKLGDKCALSWPNPAFEVYQAPAQPQV